MTFPVLLLRNMMYHHRGNLAVLLGVALGTAVLTGALLVGDSLRGSLRDLMLDLLRWVEYVMLPGPFFREALANPDPTTRTASPVILLSGSAVRTVSGVPQKRVSGVTILGVERSFWPETMRGMAAGWYDANGLWDSDS